MNQREQFRSSERSGMMLVLPVLLVSIKRLESIKLERNMAIVIMVAPVLMKSADMVLTWQTDVSRKKGRWIRWLKTQHLKT